jgi:hypothetical protein
VGDATGDGDGAFAIVTVISPGLIASTVIPGGTVMVTVTECAPAPRSVTATLATRVEVSRALSAAVAPPRVTMTLGVEREYTRFGLAPVMTTPTL